MAQEVSALHRCYPSFVTRQCQDLPAGEIPVFVFHTVVPAELEAQLTYLHINGYKTLSLDEFLDTINGRRTPLPREILLTFDDARSSFWIYGYPLLRKFAAKAILFAITGWTPDFAVRWNLDDMWSGHVTLEQLRQIDPDDREVCSWEELRRMHSSGVVTVDSHSHLHRRLFSGSQLLSAIQPKDDFSPSNAVHSPYLSCNMSPLQHQASDYLGLPVFPVRGFFQDGPALWVQREACEPFRAAAVDLMADLGGNLGTKDVAHLRSRLPNSAISVIPPEDLAADMRNEIALAREFLQRELGDPAAGRTLCVPFTLGGSTLTRIARELGLEGVFWGVSPETAINRPGDDPMGLVRLKCDFVFRLPGRGRKSVAAIYGSKLRRRLTGARPY
jgi:peptidoglycan/xylan/chitin deacetylase (PgdA/CDA1 family)